MGLECRYLLFVQRQSKTNMQQISFWKRILKSSSKLMYNNVFSIFHISCGNNKMSRTANP